MKRTRIIDAIKHYNEIGIGTEVCVKGWVRTKRGNNAVAFIALNDGSIVHNLQIVADLANFDEETMKRITTGSCLRVVGTLVESQGKGQVVEIQAKEIEVYGTADPETFSTWLI